MSADTKFLTAIGDFHSSQTDFKQSLELGDRSEAVMSAARMAGGVMRRFFYGSICTFDYAANARLIMPFPVEEVARARYGLAAGTAAGMLIQRGEELPTEFVQSLAQSEK